VHAEGGLGLVVAYGNTFLVLDLVLGLLFGFFGFRASERYRRVNGVTPWRLPSAIWAVLFFVSLLLGGVLFLIARSTTRPKVGPGDWPGGPPPGGDQFGYGGPPRDGWNAPPPGGWNQPAPPPGGWNQPAPQGWDAPVPGAWGAAPPGPPPPPGGWDAPPPPGTTFPSFGAPGAPGDATATAPSPLLPAPPPPPPRSWLPDPQGRHELRYWDGTKFTEHVADAGKISVDPI
jgi:hypothetical protein